MQSQQCLLCRRYEGALTCEAFPDVIPSAIITGQHDHREPHPGDRGLRFVPDPAMTDAAEGRGATPPDEAT